jgi:nucleotide-binding universal stress UspA family protein
VDGRLEVITVVDRLADVEHTRVAMQHGIEGLGPLPIEPTVLVHASDSVVDAIKRHLDASPGSMLAMCAHGHGRSAAVLGSTSDAILRATFGPVIMIGPHITMTDGELGGTYVVPLDGSPAADGVLPIVAAWTTEFGGRPWLIEVADDTSNDGGDWVASSMVSRRAADLRKQIHRAVEFEVVHGHRVGRSIAEFADQEQASLIFLATHGRSGLDRLRSGSVAAEVLRRATCPVVMFRPPRLSADLNLVSSGTSDHGG